MVDNKFMENLTIEIGARLLVKIAKDIDEEEYKGVLDQLLAQLLAEEQAVTIKNKTEVKK